MKTSVSLRAVLSSLSHLSFAAETFQGSECSLPQQRIFPRVLSVLVTLALGLILSSSALAESYTLPLSRNFDQGNTGLCWAYAMLSAIETRYMVQHPGETLELSRGALQFEHFVQKSQTINTEPLHKAAEDGFFGEALDLMATYGMVPYADYPDAHVRKYDSLRTLSDPQTFLQQVLQIFPPLPKQVQWQGQVLTPVEFAKVLLAQDHWTDIAVARKGESGLGPNPDSGAPPGRQALYLPLETITELIKNNLKKGIPTAYATDEHSMMIYGATYDEQGQAIQYLIKDSFMGMTYTAPAYQIHRIMNLINTIY